jgi:hypothetical protein
MADIHVSSASQPPHRAKSRLQAARTIPDLQYVHTLREISQKLTNVKAVDQAEPGTKDSLALRACSRGATTPAFRVDTLPDHCENYFIIPDAGSGPA